MRGFLKKVANTARDIVSRFKAKEGKYVVPCPTHGPTDWNGEVICDACHSLTIISKPKQFCKGCRMRLDDHCRIVCPTCFAERKSRHG